MPSGLAALLDDVASIAKIAASSLDDVSAAAGRAGTKAAGVVIDDTAVTPRYVTGFTPDRELPIIGKIALGSLRNKLIFLLPAAVLLSLFVPWAITPLLMAGGSYLCFEGAEKLIEALGGHASSDVAEDQTDDPVHLEEQKVSGAIRTDLILSAEIMAIALADVADSPVWEQAVVLAIVGVLVTAGVYGVVALIVKMDDIGLKLAKQNTGWIRATGRGLVVAMPHLMAALSIIGVAAMIWVGGGIIVHGLEEFGLRTIPHVIHSAAEAAARYTPFAEGLVRWVVGALGSGIVGLLIGTGIVFLLHRFRH